MRTKDLVLPASYGNRNYPWLLIYQERQDGAPPKYFLTHGRNYSKFETRQGFRIVGHIKDRADAIAVCREANETITGKPKPKIGHQLSKAKGEINLSGFGKPKEKKPMLILPKGFKKEEPNGG